jgi:hypothetical protein
VGQHFIDSNNDMEVVTTAGTSKAGTHPIWAAVGGSTADNGVAWMNQGPAGTYTSWIASATMATGNLILDNGGFIQEVTATAGNGHTNTTQPVWTETTGHVTTDHNVTWTNRGPAGVATIAAAGGASGIIIDNTVSTGTQAGASQVYYSTLTNGVCATSGGTGGCAVQASQAALH